MTNGSSQMTEEHLQRIEREIERERGSLETITSNEVIGLVIEVRRLRGLIKSKEWANHEETASGAGAFCPWCNEEYLHAGDCPAFTPSGEVR